jgi:DNA modification methylase
MVKHIDIVKGLSQLETGSVDCVVTSPPYWKGFSYEAYFNSYLQYIEWVEKWLIEIKRVLKNDGNFWLNCMNDSETTVRAFDLMRVATDKVMFKLHDTVVWYRYNSQPANTDRQLTNQIEYIFWLRHTSDGVCIDKKTVYEKNPEVFKTKNVGNVWEIPFNSNKKKLKGLEFGRKETKSKWGHSGFPEKLVETCLYLTTKKGDLVVDPFSGSGTTGVVCKRLGRRFIGFDLYKPYVEIANKRIEDTQKEKDGLNLDTIH